MPLWLFVMGVGTVGRTDGDGKMERVRQVPDTGKLWPRPRTEVRVLVPTLDTDREL